MDIPAPATLIELVRSLPPGEALLNRLRTDERVYLVGGAVRDLLLGGAPTDLDLVVEGDALPFAERLGGQVVRHERFGTSTVSLDGFTYDIAQARRETYARPGALPDVEPASLEEDLLRRDFTVNTLALALGPPEPGALKAAPDAFEDLERGLLRVLHAGSFLDDPTRLLRLVRYRSRLGFDVEPATASLADAAVSEGALATVSGPRIGAELRMLAREPDPLRALAALKEHRLDGAIHAGFGLRDLALGRRALALLVSERHAWRLALALASMALEAGDLRDLLDRLAFTAEDRDVIVAAATRAPEVADALGRARRPSEIFAAAAGAPAELVALAGALGPYDAARSWIERLRHVSLEIDGSDLLSAGVPEGPVIGRGLRAALEAKLDGRANGREAELGAALEAAGATG